MNATAVPVIRVRPTRGWVGLRLGELWEYRELLYFLTWRDVKVRYRQTLLGVAWAVLVPLVSTVLFTVVFGRMANVASDGVPYAVFNLAALLPWNFFAAAITQCTNSVAATSHLMSKVYFPRLIAPLAAVLAGFPDFLIALLLLLIAIIVYPGVELDPRIVFIPVFFVLVVMTALGFGLWLAGLAARYRDIRHAVPFVLQAWLFATPVVYSSNSVSPAYRVLIGLNPMTGVVEGFRWCALGIPLHPPTVFLSAAISALFLVSGAFFFRRVERGFADLL